MDGHDDNPAPKKRVRTVSTLNQEQVRKKRENDREAQRAFRERTKNRIQILEAELSELRSEREKQGGNVSQEVKGLREENAALKQQLRQISAIIGQERSSLDTGTDKETSCIFVRPQDKDDSSSFQAQTDDVQHDATNPDTPRSQADDSDNYMPIYDNALVPSISQPGTADDTTAIEGSLYDQTSDQTLEQRPPNYRQNINVLHESHHTDHIETGFDQNIKNHFSAPMYPQSPPQSTSCGSEEIRLIQDHQPARQSEHSRSLSLPSYNLGVRVHSGFESTQEVSTETSTGGTHNESNNTKGFPSRESGMYLSSAKPDSINVDIVDFASDGYLDGGMMGPSSIHGSSVSPNATSSSPAVISPSWVTPETVEPISMSNILPRHLAATCPLDQILLDFLASRRVLASHGTPVSTLIGPPNPSISGLINPKLKNSAHATSRVMVDVVSTFKDTNLREQLGFLYIMYTTLRWQIGPSQETFDMLPVWLRPTVLQVMAPHAAWIDNIPWPQVRDLLIQNPLKYTFQDFSELYARCARLDWPFEPGEAVMPKPDDSGELLMNPLFEKRVRALECWSVGEMFKARFPELASAMKS